MSASREDTGASIDAGPGASAVRHSIVRGCGAAKSGAFSSDTAGVDSGSGIYDTNSGDWFFGGRGR